MAKGGPSNTNGYCSSSSGEEDGDAAWRAAIDSVAGTTKSYISSVMNPNQNTATKHTVPDQHHDDQDRKPQTQQIKHYQLKAQKLLNEMLENRIEIVKEPVPVLDEDPNTNEGGVRLFKNAHPGIVFDHIDEPQPPRRRPRILPGGDIDEKSKKFKRKIQSVAVDGKDLMAAANDAYKNSLARLEAKDAAAKAAAKREEERVEILKKIRGERWLPSMAKEMQPYRVLHSRHCGTLTLHNYLECYLQQAGFWWVGLRIPSDVDAHRFVDFKVLLDAIPVDGISVIKQCYLSEVHSFLKESSKSYSRFKI